MISHPAVVVHGAAQALQAVASGRPVCLLSAPGAAIYAGCLWWQELVATVQRPGLEDMLDCGDAPGPAMAALRIGLRHLVLDPACPGFAAVAAAAAQLGAEVAPRRPEALDLGRPGALRQLETWLARPGTVR